MDFHAAFYEIDADHSGEITRDELIDYMRKKNYKETFVQRWLSIFDIDNSGTITYEEYCTTLGLIPNDDEKKKEKKEEAMEAPIVGATASTSRSMPPASKPAPELMEVQEQPMVSKKFAKVASEAPISMQKAAKTRAAPKQKPRDAGKQKENRERNSVISRSNGILMRFSAARVIQKKALYRYKQPTVRGGGSKKKPAPAKAPSTVTKQVDGEKNGGSRTVPTARSPRFYPSEEVEPRSANRRRHLHKNNLPRLRPSIQPGSILILVTGRHKGKRVVFLKQMEKSGLLLVTGPFKLNGCPMRRVNQCHVIATSTRVELNGLNLPERLTDAYFQRAKKERRQKEEGDIFHKESSDYDLSAERKDDQKTVDGQVMAAIGKGEEAKLMRAYLRTMFGLKRGQRPHAMKF